MDRRRAIALMLGLVLCLGLLGRWAMRSDDDASVAHESPATLNASPASSSTPDASIVPDEAAPSPTTGDDAASGPGILRGRVVDAVTRQPLREFELKFDTSIPAKTGPPAPQPRSFQSSDGRFEWRGLPAGTWTILASARGYQRFDLLDTVIADDPSTAEILIPMRRGHALRGRVFDEATNAGIAAATVTFREAQIGRYEGNFRMRPSVVTQRDGSFAMDGLPPGPVRASVSAQGYAPREIDVTMNDDMAPVAIALSTGGALTGYLAGADGLTPVAGNVSLVNIEDTSGISLETGSAGEFAFKQLAAGRYRLAGIGNGLRAQRDITLSHNERLEGIVLAMNAGRNIRGVVSGLRPDELKLVSVSVSREDEEQPPTQIQVDERGAYLVPDVKPGPVRVSADVSTRSRITRKATMPGDTDLTVNLEFPRGARLSGRVTRAGKPLPGAWLLPQPIRSTSKQEVLIYGASSSANGEYAIDDIPDGEYALWVQSYRGPTVRIAGDTVADVEVPPAHFTGRLLEDGSKVPVVGAVVRIWPAEPSKSTIWLSDRSDHFGQFALRGLEPGDFVLTVYKPGYELYRAPLAYGSPIADLAINMRPARGAEIRIREAGSGRAVTTASVMEMFDGLPGLYLDLYVDDKGVGYLPSGFAGSSLTFWSTGYLPAEIAAWDGQSLELVLRKQP